jgi:hypothetical protein
MLEFTPRYQIGEALYFRYVPFDYIDPKTGEAFTVTPEIPCTVLSIAHNLSEEIQIEPGIWLPHVLRTDWVGFFYFVEIDQEEAVLLRLDLRYPKPKDARCEQEPQTSEVIKENQITAARIAF